MMNKANGELILAYHERQLVRKALLSMAQSGKVKKTEAETLERLEHWLADAPSVVLRAVWENAIYGQEG